MNSEHVTKIQHVQHCVKCNTITVVILNSTRFLHAISLQGIDLDFVICYYLGSTHYNKGFENNEKVSRTATLMQ